MAEREVVDRYIPSGTRRRYASLQTEYADDVKGTALRIFSYFKNEKAIVAALAVVIIAGTLAAVCAPAIQGDAIDIIAGLQKGDFTRTLMFMVAAYLTSCLCQLAQGALCARLSTHIVRRVRTELFSKLIDLPIGYHDRRQQGDTMSRMTNDVENISTTVSQALPTLISGVLTVAGTALAMALMCWQLAALTWVTVFLTIGASKFLSSQVRRNSRERQATLGEVSSHVEEMISGYRTVVACNRQDMASEEFRHASDRLTSASIKTHAFSGIMGPVSSSITNIGYAIVAAAGGLLALNGIVSVGVISAFIVYMRQFSRPVNEIAALYCQLQTAIAGAERVFAVLDEASECSKGSGTSGNPSPSVIFENVNFSYIPGQPVLHDFNLTVAPGKKIALVGATGSGKTTVANLLLRFYDVDNGRILFDNKDMRDIARPSLRRDIAIVLQDTTLFVGAIRDNLLYAKEDATESELREAAKASACLRMIERLPNGFDTVIGGPDGITLSHGQMQLLAIARAFLANPKVLVLDEATSNVDTRTERAVQKAMQHLMSNRTSIVIAHRLSTIRDADQIVVLDHGRIVEQGTHQQLLETNGRYHELYMTQFAGFGI